VRVRVRVRTPCGRQVRRPLDLRGVVRLPLLRHAGVQDHAPAVVGHHQRTPAGRTTPPLPLPLPAASTMFLCMTFVSSTTGRWRSPEDMHVPSRAVGLQKTVEQLGRYGGEGGRVHGVNRTRTICAPPACNQVLVRKQDRHFGARSAGRILSCSIHTHTHTHNEPRRTSDKKKASDRSCDNNKGIDKTTCDKARHYKARQVEREKKGP
jgi:hypothetical protein